jgi:coiled-coil domain-containing protein 55
MKKSTLSYGLNLNKNSRNSKAPPPKRKPVFGSDDDSDGEAPAAGAGSEEIGELDDVSFRNYGAEGHRKSKLKNEPPTEPPKLKAKRQENTMFGDLSSALTSRKHAQTAEDLDSTIYDYDGVYDSLKPEKKETKEDVERKPKYMSNLLAAAAVRKRDALIAEEKKIAREREAEGEEYADKEKFVTEAYRKQQEENRRIEEEERQREEDEAKKNKSRGMTAFYRKMLDQGDQRHAEVMRAAEERAKAGPATDSSEEMKEKSDADIAREINERGGSVAINEDGQIVDKRQLLKGGLNIGAKKKPEPPKPADRGSTHRDDRGPSRSFVGAGGKQAMRERQSRMLEDQLAQALKRSMTDEEEERLKLEQTSKSRKTDVDVSAAKARYLARKREAEEAKRKGIAE